MHDGSLSSAVRRKGQVECAKRTEFCRPPANRKFSGPAQRTRDCIECLLDPLAHALGQAGFVALSRPGAAGKVTQAR